ncbi:MAG: hypothetical protein J3K34DRAFT_442996 [Monoraphidium minutum]|nr:MAG: hypothetical protein J3K34DRAFT_442996 [Monoraphidium minutum]
MIAVWSTFLFPSPAASAAVAREGTRASRTAVFTRRAACCSAGTAQGDWPRAGRGPSARPPTERLVSLLDVDQ